MLIAKIRNYKLRKRIHEYFEQNYFYYNKTSLSLYGFTEKFFICDECGSKISATYYFGLEENNIDEHYSGFCYNCDYEGNYCYEPNYDCGSKLYTKKINDSILFSNLITTFDDREISNLNYEEITNILRDEFKLTDIVLKPISKEIEELLQLYVKTGKKGRRNWNKKKAKLEKLLI